VTARFDPDESHPWLAQLFNGYERFPEVVVGVNQDDCAVYGSANSYWS